MLHLFSYFLEVWFNVQSFSLTQDIVWKELNYEVDAVDYNKLLLECGGRFERSCKKCNLSPPFPHSYNTRRPPPPPQLGQFKRNYKMAVSDGERLISTILLKNRGL